MTVPCNPPWGGMEMERLSFDFRDIFKSMKLGWSSRKMATAFRGILSAWAVYSVIAYAALLLDNETSQTGLTALFRHHEFFPSLCPCESGILPSIIWITGIVAATLVLMQTAAVISRLAFQDLRGHEVYQCSEARIHMKGMRKSLLVAVLAPFLIFIMMLIPLALTAGIGRIPVIGPFIAALLLLPALVIAFIAAVMLYTGFTGLWLAPAIAAISGGDALEIIVETFSTALKHPIKQLIYQILSRIAITIGTSFFALSGLAALILCIAPAGWIMGGTFSETTTVALFRIPGLLTDPGSIKVILLIEDILGVTILTGTGGLSFPVMLAGWISGIALLAAILMLLSYAVSICYSAQVVIYIALNQQLRGEDIRLKQAGDYFIPEIPQ